MCSSFLTFDVSIKIEILQLHALLAVSMPNILLVIIYIYRLPYHSTVTYTVIH